MRLAVFLAAVLAVPFAGCSPDSSAAPSDDASTTESPSGDSDVIEVTTAEALVKDLDSVEAETVVLNFWATWCGPCRMEFPEFIRYDQEMAADGVEVRFVSLDQPVDLALVHAFLDEHEIQEPSYLYTGQGDVTTALNPFVGNTLPVTMVLDADRIVRATHVGLMTYDELTETVASVREGEPTAS